MRLQLQMLMLTQDFDRDFVGNPFSFHVGREAGVLASQVSADVGQSEAGVAGGSLAGGHWLPVPQPGNLLGTWIRVNVTLEGDVLAFHHSSLVCQRLQT